MREIVREGERVAGLAEEAEDRKSDRNIER